MQPGQMDRIEHKVDLLMGTLIYKELRDNLIEHLENKASNEEEIADEEFETIDLYREMIEYNMSRYLTLFHEQGNEVSVLFDHLLESCDSNES